MTPREFYYLVRNMRRAQRTYFRTRDQRDLRLARALEGDVDAEIRRVDDIIAERERTTAVEGQPNPIVG